MKKDLQKKETIQHRLAKLAEERKRILSLPAQQALAEILESPQALPLVHSFPEEDLYFLIHDIGVEDCLPLLSMATTSQWEFILDLDLWEKDRIATESMIRWMDRLVTADPHRSIRWLRDEKPEIFEPYLFKNIEVRIREHDQDFSDFGPGFFTFDDVYYVRFIDYPFEPKIEGDARELREELLAKVLKYIAEDDHEQYQHLLLEASSVIPAESEEEAYRLKNIRLAEKGFLPFDEAIGVYQPISPNRMNAMKKKRKPGKTGQASGTLTPLYPIAILGEESLFSRSLMLIKDKDVLQHVQLEFAGLCNRIISADQTAIRAREELRGIVKKACGYISIGLEHLLNSDKPTADESAAIIQTYSLTDVFRIGFGEALKLKWQADKWKRESWYLKKGLSLTFWGENWMGVLGGLLLKKPLFYDNYKTGVLYREFSTQAEIRQTEKTLNEIIWLDRLLSVMAIEMKDVSDLFLTYKNLILTLWARHCLGLSKDLSALHLNEFKHFFSGLFKNSPIPPNEREQGEAHQVEIAMKTSLLNWLATETGITGAEISGRLGWNFENLFKEIEEEYGKVPLKDLDPRYIQLFLVR